MFFSFSKKMDTKINSVTSRELFHFPKEMLSAEEKLEKLSVDKVVEHLMIGGEDIGACRGKDVVILMGPTQIGKSTAVNALLGVRFQFEAAGFGVERSGGEDVRAAIGANGVSCTVSPKVYESRKYGLVLVDTVGWLGNEDAEAAVAGSILMDRVAKMAKSIKLVFVFSYDQLCSGLPVLKKYAERVSLITNEVVPAYFLFNRFRLNPRKEEEFYMLQDFHEKEEFMMKELDDRRIEAARGFDKDCEIIKSRIGEMCEEHGINPEGEDVVDTLEEKLGKEELDKFYESVRQSEHQKLFVEIMTKSFENKMYSCYDPTSLESIDMLANQLERLECVKKESLRFHESSDKLAFSRRFAHVLQKHVPLMKYITFSKRYPDDMVRFFKIEFDGKYIELKEELERDPKFKDKSLGEKYLKQLQAKELEVRENLEEWKEQIDISTANIDRMGRAPSEIIHKEEWSFVNTGFLPYKHHVRYENEEQFTIEEKFEDPAPKANIITHTSTVFEAEYKYVQIHKSIAAWTTTLLVGTVLGAKQVCKGCVVFKGFPKDTMGELMKQKEAEIDCAKAQIVKLEKQMKAFKKIMKKGPKKHNAFLRDLADMQSQSLMEILVTLKGVADAMSAPMTVRLGKVRQPSGEDVDVKIDLKLTDQLLHYLHVADAYFSEDTALKWGIDIFRREYLAMCDAERRDVEDVGKIIHAFQHLLYRDRMFQ